MKCELLLKPVSVRENIKAQVIICVTSPDMIAKKQSGSWLKDWKAEEHGHWTWPH